MQNSARARVCAGLQPILIEAASAMPPAPRILAPWCAAIAVSALRGQLLDVRKRCSTPSAAPTTAIPASPRIDEQRASWQLEQFAAGGCVPPAAVARRTVCTACTSRRRNDSPASTSHPGRTQQHNRLPRPKKGVQCVRTVSGERADSNNWNPNGNALYFRNTSSNFIAAVALLRTMITSLPIPALRQIPLQPPTLKSPSSAITTKAVSTFAQSPALPCASQRLCARTCSAAATLC